jgi:hypothetical protein
MMEYKVRYVKNIFFLVIVAVLVSGCVIGDGERDYAMSRSMPPDAQLSPLTPAAIPTSSIPTLPFYDLSSGYWITVDPIGDKQVDENLTITTKTNLLAGEDVDISVFHRGPYIKTQTGACSCAFGKVKVTAGSDGINTTSFDVNLSQYHVNIYDVFVSGIKKNATGHTSFNITPIKTPKR